MWDNRASMHYAVADYWPARRLMHRLTIETDALGLGKAAGDAA
jgi:taurine dioxygenase